MHHGIMKVKVGRRSLAGIGKAQRKMVKKHGRISLPTKMIGTVCMVIPLANVDRVTPYVVILKQGGTK